MQTKKAKKYQRKLQRLASSSADTPRSKTKRLIGKAKHDINSKKTVCRTLEFHFSLMNQIKANKANRKRSISDIVRGEILRKYRFRTRASSLTGSRHPRIDKKIPKNSISARAKAAVTIFYERDDVSRITSSKKDTVTRYKIKKQRRVLCDFLGNLYNKYKAETLDTISFTTFWRLKPFWVTYPRKSDRETCLCRCCENTEFMAQTLYTHNITDSACLRVLVRQAVCNPENKMCMYDECQTCEGKHVNGGPVDPNLQVSWEQWETHREEYVPKSGDPKTVTVTGKSLYSSTARELWDNFHKQLLQYKRHAFNVSNQLKHYRKLRQDMKPNECLVHIDFSENFLGKRNREIQSMHFGASQSQITLHTGCYFVGAEDKPHLFCGVSDSLQHDPAAVWSFLRPVLKLVKCDHPEIDTVHFYSDGPTTQYRQKINFYLLSTQIYQMGFTSASWNFMASGHGKEIPDGVGAAIKRAADQRVLHGSDIVDSKTLVDQLSQTDTSIHLYTITADDIEVVEKEVEDKTLKTVPGTMKLHQVIVVAPELIKCREVSCKCMETACPGHCLREFSFAPWGSQGPTGSCLKRKEEAAAAKKHHSQRKKKNQTRITGQSDSNAKDSKSQMDFTKNSDNQTKCTSYTEDKIQNSSGELAKF